MEYLIYLAALVVGFLLTKYYYYNKGFEDGYSRCRSDISNSLLDFSYWFNENYHPAMVGNTLYEISCQLRAHGWYFMESVRDLVTKEGGTRFHDNINKYTKRTKNGI
jgi:hypothetical protein